MVEVTIKIVVYEGYVMPIQKGVLTIDQFLGGKKYYLGKIKYNYLLNEISYPVINEKIIRDFYSKNHA